MPGNTVFDDVGVLLLLLIFISLVLNGKKKTLVLIDRKKRILKNENRFEIFPFFINRSLVVFIKRLSCVASWGFLSRSIDSRSQAQ